MNTKLIFKSPRYVPFGANLAQFEDNLTSLITLRPVTFDLRVMAVTDGKNSTNQRRLSHRLTRFESNV